MPLESEAFGGFILGTTGTRRIDMHFFAGLKNRSRNLHTAITELIGSPSLAAPNQIKSIRFNSGIGTPNSRIGFIILRAQGE